MEKIINILPLILFICLLIAFLIMSTTKGWMTFKRRGFFTSQVSMYEFLAEDKQKAMDEVIEYQAGEKEEEDDTGEKPVPGEEKLEE